MLQLLGLLLPKYVPDEALLRQPSWVGVVRHADALVPMLQQHVLEPLLNGEHWACQATSLLDNAAVFAVWHAEQMHSWHQHAWQ